ncbi:hypothetical protein ACPCSC_12190 [Streptomyces lavendulocolor]|uniref:hypothetical protein n=1 Tax=Streptomyces lavendulocolor TaxID=67316 RepID=UPI003C2D5E94
MQQPPSMAFDLVAAFPHRLSHDVRAVSAVMPESPITPASPFSVHGGEEAVAIPYRIYQDEPPGDLVRPLTEAQRVILHCLYSRHCDGLVRQRHMEHIAGSAEPWCRSSCNWPASTSWRSWSPYNTTSAGFPASAPPSGRHTATSSHGIPSISPGPNAGW